MPNVVKAYTVYPIELELEHHLSMLSEVLEGHGTVIHFIFICFPTGEY